MTAPDPVQQRYLALIAAIERRFAVAEWTSGDAHLWPPARMDLFLDMFRAEGRDTAPAPPTPVRGAIASLAAPFTNVWKSRHDLAHWVAWPGRAYAMILGDGVSLDHVDGAWQDRYGEPVIAALDRAGLDTALLQPGDPRRLPWRRPTFPANSIAGWGAALAAVTRCPQPSLPDHGDVLAFLAAEGVDAPSLGRARLIRRARSIAATAGLFQRILRRVRPRLAFTITHYAGLGHAFALACRRESVLCVDLQHCPQDGTHKAYGWDRVPPAGYTTLPGLFWTWREDDAAFIRRWTSTLAAPWHQSLAGGHTQLMACRDAEPPDTDDAGRYERNILIALQPIGGYRAVWDALAKVVEAAPANWRWWIRRHPSSTPAQDGEYAGLLAPRRANVVIEEAGTLPLPRLLPRMSALVSLASGAAGEAALLGIPAFFLSEQARGSFAGLIARGEARLIDVDDLASAIAGLDRPSPGRALPAAPPIMDTLRQLDRIARAYAQLCRESRVPASSEAVDQQVDRGARIAR
jgi:hypothetical protein